MQHARCEVVNDVVTLERHLRDLRAIGDIAFEELRLLIDRQRFVLGDVADQHLLACFEQVLHGVAADEAIAAENDVLHRLSSAPRRRCRRR